MATKRLKFLKRVKIRQQDVRIRVEVNGELVNEGTNLVDLPGRIGLETEFGTIQYRNLRLTPIG